MTQPVFAVTGKLRVVLQSAKLTLRLDTALAFPTWHGGLLVYESVDAWHVDLRVV